MAVVSILHEEGGSAGGEGEQGEMEGKQVKGSEARGEGRQVGQGCMPGAK